MGEGAQQPGVVALVQADGGLVQDVHDPDEAGPDLAGQADALGLAAGEGLGAACQGQVVEPHVHQEAQAQGDLLDDLGGDLAAGPGDGQGLAQGQGRADGHGGDGRQIMPGDEDMACRLVEPGPAAGGAGLAGEVAGQFLAHRVGVGLAVAPLHVADDALEGPLPGPALPGQGHGDGLLATAIQDDLADGLRQCLPGGLRVEAVMGPQGTDLLEVVGVAPVPAAHGAGAEPQFRVQDDLGRVEELLHPQPVAGRAGPGRVVEGEEPRLGLRDAVAALGAGEPGGEGQLRGWLAAGPSIQARRTRPSERRKGGLDGLRQAQAQVGTHPKAVDHHLDVVLALEVQVRRVVQLVDVPIDAGAHEALGVQFRQQALVLPLARRDHRGQQHEPGPLRLGQDLIHHLGDGLGRQGGPVLRAARFPHPGEEQAQVVVDLGDGPDGGAGVVGGGLLLDGDGRGQALDVVDVRLLHDRQELPGIGREGLHIAPLALGIDGVEGQGRLAGPRKPGEDDEAVPGQVEVDVLEVVGAGAADADAVHGVYRSLRRREACRARRPADVAQPGPGQAGTIAAFSGGGKGSRMGRNQGPGLAMTGLERRAAAGLAGIFAFRMLGLFLVLPVFAVQAQGLAGATPLLIGLAIGAYGLTQAMLRHPLRHALRPHRAQAGDLRRAGPVCAGQRGGGALHAASKGSSSGGSSRAAGPSPRR